MGSLITPTQTAAGIGTPLEMLAWTGALSVSGGYDAAQVEAGPVAASAETGLVLEASGTPDTYSPATETTARVVRAGQGGRGPDSSGIAYRHAATWYGRERPSLLTGYQNIETTGTNTVIGGAVALDDGRVVLVALEVGGDVYSWTRSAAGVWGAQVAVATESPYNATIIRAPDGELLVYAFESTAGYATTDLRVAVYRSTDAGATWTKQAADALGVGFTSSPGGPRIVAIADAIGGVALWISSGTGTANVATQYASSDGGYSFTEVVESAAGFEVQRATTSNGLIHIVTVEYDGVDSWWYHRRGASAFDPIIGGTRTIISADGQFNGVSYIVEQDSGVLLAGVTVSASEMVAYRSNDGGTTWVTRDSGPGWADTTISFAHAVSLRQQVIIFSRNAAVTAITEARFGGNSSLTLGVDVRRMEAESFWPVEDTAAQGWTNTDTGTVTRTLSPATGERVAAGAVSTGETISTGTGTVPCVALVCLRPVWASGNETAQIDVSGDTDTVRIQIDDDGTIVRIRCYDAGAAAPAYTTIATPTGGFLEVAVVCEGANAYVWHRTRDNATERTWTTLGAGAITLGTGTRTSSNLTISVFNSDTIDILHAWASFPVNPSLTGGGTYPADLMPIPLSSRPTYLWNGISVRNAAGLVTVDGVTHTVGYTTPYRGESIVPDLSPSPRAVWRSASEAEQILSWTVADTHGGASAVYLAGLRNITTLTVNVGDGARTVTLGADFRYDCIGTRAIRGSTTVSTATSLRWVRADELAGARVTLASGTWRTVTGNTEGWLRYGVASAEHRAVIYLDGDNDTGTNKAGKLVASWALIKFSGTASTITVTVAGTASNPSTAEGYREIGAVVPVGVHVLGLVPDLSDEWSRSDDAAIQTMADGQRYTARQAPDLRRVRIAYVASAHEVRQVDGTSTSSDYVTITGGAADGSWNGIPYALEGIVARADGRPVLWLPDTSSDTLTQITCPPGRVPLYGRIVGGVSIEGVPMVGARGISQMFRVPAITIEGER